MCHDRASGAYQAALRRIEEARQSGARELDLSRPGLTELPATIGQVTQLHRLRVAGCELKALPKTIGQLSQLRELHLADNQLSVLPKALRRLRELRALILYNNRLQVLPEGIGELKELRALLVHGNELKTLPDAIGRLRRLRKLTLGDNRLATLPGTVGDLEQLEILHLNGNQLSELPASFGKLAQLRRLGLQTNFLQMLPAQMRSLGQLELLLLHDNEQLGIPPEILGPRRVDTRRGWDSVRNAGEILNYYLRMRPGARRLNEAKLLVVGEGDVGKTSLVNRLVRDEYNPDEPSTPGIGIEQWWIDGRGDAGHENEQVRVNIWDFGGQEIMYATHQIFLTKRSLYLLVIDARQGETRGNIHYWLRIIQSYAADAPILIVINKCEMHQLALNETRLRKDYYPNVRGFFSISCATGMGIAALSAEIGRQIHALPHVFDELPGSYFEVKEELESRASDRDYVTVDEYQRLCSEHEIGKSSAQRELLPFLHDLGSVLNFDQQESRYDLHEPYILNPEWVTDGIYRILNNHELMQAQGKVEIDRLGEVLKPSDGYPPERHRAIINIMRRFELCFDYPDSGGGSLLVPQLLQENEPDIEWRDDEALRFEYRYSALPTSVYSRFLSRTHEFLTRKPTVWRSGVLLNIQDNHALVRWDTRKGRMYISVFGNEQGRRRALARIRKELKQIHAALPKLAAVEHVPLPRDPGATVSLEHLIRLQKAGIGRFLPEGADLTYEVGELLSLVEHPRAHAGAGRSHTVTTGRGSRVEEEVPPMRADFPFDVFLSYHSKDQEVVLELAHKLKACGLLVWLDKWELTPGQRWQDVLGRVIKATYATAVLVGPSGIGPWQHVEMHGALNEYVRRGTPVIPVLLPGVGNPPELPLFLSGFTWSDLREGLTQEGIDWLVRGIMGKKPN